MSGVGESSVARALRAAGAKGEVREFDASTRTAAEAAAALGCPVGAIANSLVFVADGTPILVLASGAHRVDLESLAAALGCGELRRASPEEVRAATGQVIGGVAPLGHPAPLRAVIDEALRDHEVLWASAGSPHSVFSTDFEELRGLAGALPVTVTPPA
ncbi:MAG TPA: YbaK/EbsC family protein [Acidimicrobiales bacterium]|nr:YbaK/EbsC family protein [Acidimicrobiales bacterium]